MLWIDKYNIIKKGNIETWKDFIDDIIMNNISYKARKEHLIRIWDDLQETDFMITPASTHYHHAYEHGLIKHTCETISLAFSIRDACGADVNWESLFTCSLIHDYGKVGKYKENPRYGVDEKAYSYTYVNRKADLTDPMRSVIYAAQMIPDIGEDEIFAILYHDGLYPDENLRSKNKETPLLLMLHWADMWSASQDQFGW